MSVGSSQVKKSLYIFIFVYQLSEGRGERTRRETLALEGSGGVTNGRIFFPCRVFFFLFSIPLVLHRTWFYLFIYHLVNSICMCYLLRFITPPSVSINNHYLSNGRGIARVRGADDRFNDLKQMSIASLFDRTSSLFPNRAKIGPGFIEGNHRRYHWAVPRLIWKWSQ